MVVIDQRHASVVEMACTVPDSVLLLDSHVAHLDRQEVLEDWLPDAPLIDIGSNAEGI